MAASSSLTLLSELTQTRVDQATIHLGRKRQEQQQQEQQLAQIERYIAMYEDGLARLGQRGATSAQFEQQRAFIRSLCSTREHQQHQVTQAALRTDRALADWQDAQRTLNAYAVLQTRRDKALQGKAKRLEQRQMDEYASRAQAMMSGE